MIKPNPFTPKSGLEPRVFVNRDKEINLFESNKIRDISRKVRIKSINEYFRRLIDKGILKTQGRGEYVICDKMLGEYLQRN